MTLGNVRHKKRRKKIMLRGGAYKVQILLRGEIKCMRAKI